jgi:hypothetical protein
LNGWVEEFWSVGAANSIDVSRFEDESFFNLFINRVSIKKIGKAKISNKTSQPKVIERLYEEERFPGRELAALVLSKIYYHLEEYKESLSYALGAGQWFDLTEKTE